MNLNIVINFNEMKSFLENKDFTYKNENGTGVPFVTSKTSLKNQI